MRKYDPFEFSGVKPCECRCHHDGQSMFHCVACCPLENQTYLNDDGSIDEVAYGRAIRRDRERQVKYQKIQCGETK